VEREQGKLVFVVSIKPSLAQFISLFTGKSRLLIVRITHLFKFFTLRFLSRKSVEEKFVLTSKNFFSELHSNLSLVRCEKICLTVCYKLFTIKLSSVSLRGRGLSTNYKVHQWNTTYVAQIPWFSTVIYERILLATPDSICGVTWAMAFVANQVLNLSWTRFATWTWQKFFIVTVKRYACLSSEFYKELQL